MIDVPIDQVPELPVQDILAGECVAYGVFDQGVLVHYLERDLARLVTWEDMVLVGIAEEQLHKCNSSDVSDVREIEKPVVP